MYYSFTDRSQNKKLGGAAATMTSPDSCPGNCAIKEICYAKFGPVSWQWKKVKESLDALLNWAKNLPKGWYIRHNVAGDMAIPGTNNLDTELVAKLADAFKGKRSWTYTHCELTPDAIEAIKSAQQKGFVINVSCETTEKVKLAKANGLNAVLAIPEWSKKQWTEDGITYQVCRDYTAGKVCLNCNLCSVKNRKHVICFPAHGTRKNKAIILLKQLNA